MQGRGNGKFINHINKQVICFIVTVLHHTLKAWSSGNYQKQEDFQGIKLKGDHNGPYA